MIALFLLCMLPLGETTRDRVDLIEINHFYDDAAKPVFSQIIFMEWDNEASRYQVRAWRLLKTPEQLPQRDWKRGGYRAVWHDGDFFREVRAKFVRESWTQVDPELVEREFFPKEKRRELSKIRN